MREKIFLRGHKFLTLHMYFKCLLFMFNSKGGNLRTKANYGLSNTKATLKISKVLKWLLYGFSVQDSKNVVYEVRGNLNP